MVWYLFWFLSALVLLGSFALVFIGKKFRGRVKPIYALVAGVFVSAALMNLPGYLQEFSGAVSGLFKAIVLSVADAVYLFALNGEYGNAAEAVTGLAPWLREGYGVLGSVLFLTAPLLTFGFVLSFFQEKMANLGYWLRPAADTYVFSELNQNAVLLAESIRKKDGRAVLIFADVPQEEGLTDDDLRDRAGKIGALCQTDDISLVRLKKKTGGKKTYFFALCEKEEDSITETMQLIEKYRERENTFLYLFSDSIQSELLLNNMDKGRMVVRRINTQTAFVHDVLRKEGPKLFESATPTAEGGKDISVVIVGAGKLGTKMLRTLAWYCQMDGYRVRINAFDRDPEAGDRIKAQCPELISEKYNGVMVEGEAFYQIKIHHANMETETFREKIRQLKNVTFAFVALGDDIQNVTTAVNMRILFEQMHIHPKILAVVSDPEKSAILAGAKDRNGTPYDISFVGDLKSLYCADVMVQSELEQEALALHMRYSGGNPYGFYEFEYNYESSMASVQHFAARVACGIPGAGKAESELTPQERDIIEILEHKRWNAYMRSTGHIYSGSKDRSSRNDLGKMHHNLVEYEALTEEDKRKDSRVGAK